MSWQPEKGSRMPAFKVPVLGAREQLDKQIISLPEGALGIKPGSLIVSAIMFNSLTQGKLKGKEKGRWANC